MGQVIRHANSTVSYIMPTVLSKNPCFLAKALLIILFASHIQYILTFCESYTVVSKTAAAKFYDNIQNDT